MMDGELKHTSKFKAWISAMRLRTLPLSFSVILMGNAIAYAYVFLDVSLEEFQQNLQYEHYNWNIFVLTLVTTLFLQILSNFANDYGDSQKGADNDQRIGPERAIQSGIITKKEMLVGMVIASSLSLGSGIWLLFESFGSEIDVKFIVFFLLGIAAIAAAIKYTVGKGAYGYHALGDAFVFLFFGILGVCGSHYLQDKTFHWIILIPASQMGFLSVAVLNLNNMRDRVNDGLVGKKTIPVILGFKSSKIYHTLLFVLAWGPFIYINMTHSMLKSYGNEYTPLLYVAIIVFHLFHLIKVWRTKEPKEYDPELKKIALSTFVLGLISFILVTSY